MGANGASLPLCHCATLPLCHCGSCHTHLPSHPGLACHCACTTPLYSTPAPAQPPHSCQPSPGRLLQAQSCACWFPLTESLVADLHTDHKELDAGTKHKGHAYYAQSCAVEGRQGHRTRPTIFFGVTTVSKCAKQGKVRRTGRKKTRQR